MSFCGGCRSIGKWYSLLTYCGVLNRRNSVGVSLKCFIEVPLSNGLKRFPFSTELPLVIQVGKTHGSSRSTPPTTNESIPTTGSSLQQLGELAKLCTTGGNWTYSLCQRSSFSSAHHWHSNWLVEPVPKSSNHPWAMQFPRAGCFMGPCILHTESYAAISD